MLFELIKTPQNSYVRGRVLDIECRHHSRRLSEESQHIARINQFRSSFTTSLSSSPSQKFNSKYSARSPSLESKNSEYIETAPYAILPSSPEELTETFGRKNRLHSDTDSSLNISKFQYNNKKSSNPSVLDLSQQEVDKPIERKRNIPKSSPYLRMASIGQAQLPRIEVYSPSGSSKMSQESSRLVSRSKSKFNDPFRDKYSIKASAAQGTLSYGREIQMNETSSQPSLIGTGEAAYRNKGITSKSSSSLEIQDRLAKNLDKTEDSEIIADQGTNEELSSKIDEVTNLVPVPGILLLSSNNPTLTSISEAPNNIVPIHDTIVPLEPAISDNGTSCPVAPEIPALAIQKSSNSKKGKKTLKQGYRMTRRAIMRKGVLQILVGRELAGPAKEIIKRSCEGPAEMENTLF